MAIGTAILASAIIGALTAVGTTAYQGQQQKKIRKKQEGALASQRMAEYQKEFQARQSRLRKAKHRIEAGQRATEAKQQTSTLGSEVFGGGSTTTGTF